MGTENKSGSWEHQAAMHRLDREVQALTADERAAFAERRIAELEGRAGLSTGPALGEEPGPDAMAVVDGVAIPPAEEAGNSYYWTAIPQALRDVTGDPISGPPVLPRELRERIEGYCDSTEQGITWDDDPEVEAALLGYIVVDSEGEAEDTAAGLAVEFGAFAILERDDFYAVHGQTVLPPDKDGKHGFFEWAVVVVYGDEGDEGDEPGLLDGLLRCGGCGGPMHAATLGGERHYVCGNDHASGNEGGEAHA